MATDDSEAQASRDGEPSIDPFAFRRVIGHFATGVTVVTTVVDDLDHAMTASAFTSVSLAPTLVLVCVDKDARFHDAVLNSGQWGVSILSADDRRAAEWLATQGRPLIGQLDRYEHHRGHATGAALLDTAIAWLECRTTAVYDGGDHDIVLGAVHGLALNRNHDHARPLLYYRGRYREMPG